MIFVIGILVFCLVEKTNGICNNKCFQCHWDTCKECIYGYWGYNCQKDCENCWVSGCEKESGRCIQCKPGLYHVDCDRPCPVNCKGYRDTVHCDRHTGKCAEGCNLGWWGDQCQNKCSPGCQKACFQDDGACISDCRKGYFGRSCNLTCSVGCIHKTCNWLTGHCHGGCKCGYVGSTCKDDCSSNCNTPCKFDTDTGCLLCRNKCNRNCINEKCFGNGSCTDGCQDGFYGEDCHHKCPSECKSCESQEYCSSCLEGKTGRYCTDIPIEVITIDVEIDEKSKITTTDVNTLTTGTFQGDASSGRESFVLTTASVVLSYWSSERLL